MSSQKKVDLNEPLDINAKPTLNKANLTPKLAEAALTLHGDFYRQLQGKCNRHIFWHPTSLIFMSNILIGYGVYIYYDLIVVSESVQEFANLFWNNKYTLTKLFPILILLFALIGLSSFLVSEEFRTISDELNNPKYFDQLFGFDLKKYAKLLNNNELTPKQTNLLNVGSKNSQIILYRDSPIAIVTLKPLFENSTKSNFFVKITGLNVKAVFAKVDFDTLLLEWSIIRSREIFQEYVNDQKLKKVDGCKINILIDGFSFDDDFNKIITQSSFGFIKRDYNINPFITKDKEDNIFNVIKQSTLNKFFGVSKFTYGLTLYTKNEDEDLLLKNSHSSYSKKPVENERKQIRKRKN